MEEELSNEQKENTEILSDNKKEEINLDLNDLENQINYKYNEKGELVHKKTGEKVGKLEKDEYEKVGKYVEKYLENYFLEKLNLTVLYVPNNKSTDFSKRDKNQAQCKILTTKDFPTNPKCLIIIQGAGPVRLGQWARSLCINDNLFIGSMIPYVQKAVENNTSVIILNINMRTDYEDEKKLIEEFSTHEKHSLYVYNNIIKKNKNIKEIYIVAHSVGGDCALEILFNNITDLTSGKIKKIAFTDTVHGEEYEKLGKKGVKIFRNISRNFVCSDKPAGTFLNDCNNIRGIECYSSGHHRHEYTSGCAIDEVFKFLKSDSNKGKNNCNIF